MRSRLLAAVAILTALLGGQAFAQTVEVEVLPEQRTIIREHVTRERIAPVTTIREPVRRGYRVPAEVELREVPAAWGPSVSRYRYIYQGNRVHFVDPSTREVIYDID